MLQLAASSPAPMATSLDTALERDLFQKLKDNIHSFITGYESDNPPASIHARETETINKLKGIIGELEVFLTKSDRSNQLTAMNYGMITMRIRTLAEATVLRQEKFETVVSSWLLGSSETKKSLGISIVDLNLKNAITRGLLPLLDQLLEQHNQFVKAKREETERTRMAQEAKLKADEEARFKAEEAERERKRQEESEKKLKELESKFETRFSKTEELIATEKQAREQAEARARKAEEDAQAQRDKMSEMENKLVLYNDALGSFRSQFLLIKGPEAQQLLPMFQQLLQKLGEPALPALEAPATTSAASAAASSAYAYSPIRHLIESPSKNTEDPAYIAWKKSNSSQYEQYLLQDCIAKSRYYAICELIDLYKKFKPINGTSSLHAPVPAAEVVKSLIHELLSSTRWSEAFAKSIEEVINPALSKVADRELEQCLSLIKTFTMYSDDLPSSYSKLKDRLVVLAKVIGQGNFVPVNRALASDFMKKSEDVISTPQHSNGQKPV